MTRVPPRLGVAGCAVAAAEAGGVLACGAGWHAANNEPIDVVAASTTKWRRVIGPEYMLDYTPSERRKDLTAQQLQTSIDIGAQLRKHELLEAMLLRECHHLLKACSAASRISRHKER